MEGSHPQPAQPLGPRRLDFNLLSAEDFELFSFFVVQIDFPNARRLRPPEQGADAILHGSDGKVERCWQFKRYGAQISWPKCKESLDAAVEEHGMGHYTFCFARDLTGNQHRLFGEHLVGRHPGIHVDYVGSSDLHRQLLASDQGRRIEKYFYGDAALDTETLMEAIRAGGALGDGADVAQRMAVIAEYLQRRDPLYSFITGTREADVPPAPLHPGTIIALEMSDGKTVQRFEAIPRNPQTDPEILPGGHLTFDGTPEGRSAWESFRHALSTGEQTALSSGVNVELTGLPGLMQDIAGEPGELAQVVIGPSAPVLWRARAKVATDLGKDALDIDLRRVAPVGGAEATFEGRSGAFELTCSLRRTATGGAASMTWTYSGSHDEPLAEHAAALAFVEAMHGKGTLTLVDRDRIRPNLPFTFASRPVPPELMLQRRFVEALVEIEGWAGRPLRIPSDLTPELVRQVLETAEMMRQGHGRFTVGEFELVLDDAGRQLLEDRGPLMFSAPWVFIQEGEEIILGWLRGVVPEWSITHEEPLQAEGAARTRVRIEPAPRAKSVEFELLRDDPQTRPTGQ